jgi:hypothetical protein
VRRAWIATLAVAAGAAAALAQQEAPAPREPAEEPAAQELPSLDDLLGIETEGKPDEGDPAQDAALERALSDEEVADAFRQAVTEMGDVANLLEAGQPGARAQRLQEDIILKLEMLIDQAQRQQSSSSSSSSQQQQQQQQQSPTRNQQRAQQQQQQASQGDNQGESLPPGGREGELGELIQASSASWGALPERVREALLQGTGDRFSSLYESLTEAYFRRLAEESSER